MTVRSKYLLLGVTSLVFGIVGMGLILVPWVGVITGLPLGGVGFLLASRSLHLKPGDSFTTKPLGFVGLCLNAAVLGLSLFGIIDAVA